MLQSLRRWISGTTFLTTVLVVALHFSTFSKITDSSFFSGAILYFSHGIATVAVPSFFFFSGYLLFRNVENISDLLMKLKKRVKTLIIPYIFWNVCYMLVMIAGSAVKKGINSADISLKNILQGIFLHKYVFNMWFLLVLIINTFLFSFAVICLKKYKPLSVIIAVLLTVTSFLVRFTVYFPDTNAILFSLHFFVYWLIGCLCTDKCIEYCFEFLRKRKWVAGICSVAVILLLAYPTMLSKNKIAFTKSENMLVFILTVAFLIFTVVFADRLLVTKENMGMVIYGAHGFFAITISALLLKFKSFISYGAVAFILYAAAVAATVAVIYFTGKFIKRYIPPLYKICAGGR